MGTLGNELGRMVDDFGRTDSDPLPGNPCPFLRGLVNHGAIAADIEPLPELGQVVARAFGDPKKETETRAAVGLIGLTANGLNPLTQLRNRRSGLHVNELRGGPLDKHGAGSGVLDQAGIVDYAQLDRLDQFAKDFRNAETGEIERGLGSAQLVELMDANFERAADFRRHIDRKMMDAEWPKLLEVMAKPSPDGDYLAVDEVRDLVIDLRLPERVVDRLGPK